MQSSSRAELERFEALLSACERLRPDGLGFEELRELAHAYRRLTAELARLRDRGVDPEAIRYLNALCVRAHAHLSAPRRANPSDPALAARIRAALARTFRAQLAAWALLALGVYVGAALVAREPKAAYALVPASLGYSPARLDRLLASPEERLEFLTPEPAPMAARAFFGSQLFARNTRVGMFALATGILAGLPTLVLSVYNGVILGAFGAIFLRPPHALEFLAWILPHGIPEFTAISLCSAAGLLLGVPLVAPGRRGRRAALRAGADAALLLLAAAIPLFVLAALAESFVRESALGIGPRLAVAAGMALIVALLLTTSGRAARARPDTSWLRELSAPTSPGSPGSGSSPAP